LLELAQKYRIGNYIKTAFEMNIKAKNKQDVGNRINMTKARASSMNIDYVKFLDMTCFKVTTVVLSK
jgi:hypothetical protein